MLLLLKLVILLIGFLTHMRQVNLKEPGIGDSMRHLSNWSIRDTGQKLICPKLWIEIDRSETVDLPLTKHIVETFTPD